MADTIATQQKLDFDFFLDSSWEGTFDRVELWRSRLSTGGPYEALTAATWTPARLPAGAGDRPSAPETGPQVVAVGKKLNLLVNEKVALEVTFTGSDPLTLAQCATQVQAQGGGFLSSYVKNNQLVIETVQPGGQATLRLVGGDAAPTFGLLTTEPDSVAFGKDAHISLTAGVTQYTGTDYNGSSSFWYKTRFRHTVSGAVSEFTAPFQVAAGGAGLGNASLITGFVDLVDSAGNALKNREVFVYNKFDGTVVDGRVVAGGTQKLLTDENGRAEFTLVRGAYVIVGVSNTSLVRDVLVPTDPTLGSFNLLSVEFGQDDLFKVQVPQLTYGVRRSM